jgi:hypothetical protein
MNAARVDHENPKNAQWLFVDWTMGTACNYKCSYCPPELHDGRRAFPQPERVVAFANTLAAHSEKLQRAVFIQFTGGEITLYSHLPFVLKELKARGIHCGLISNASRSLACWREIAPWLDAAVLTHHIEFADLDHFREIARMLSEQIRTHIQITMLPSRFADCLESAQAIRAACPRAFIGLKPLRKSFGAELYDYTPEQLETLRRPPVAPACDPLPGGVRGRMLLREGTSSAAFSAGQILACGLNHWHGWRCYAGQELLAISAEGEIYRGLCRQGGSFGNMNATYVLPVESVVCEHRSCSCLTDIMTTKIQIDVRPAGECFADSIREVSSRA